MADGVTCSLLPTKMREFAEEWNSSGSVAAFDFGSGPVTASNINTTLQVQSGSLTARPDGLSLDYQTAWAFGPIEVGSTISGSINSSWRVRNIYTQSTQTGSVFLDRENDAQDNWRTGSLLFTYTGSAIKEIDLTFDQSARPVVCGDRDSVISGSVTTSLVHLYRFVTILGDFAFSEVATGSTPRVILDDPVDTSASDILLFYVKSLTSENAQENFVLASGSGIDDVPSSSFCSDAITMSLTPYKVSAPATREQGFFSSLKGTGPSIGITGSFNTPVRSVGARIVDPDFETNEIIAFDIAGAEIARKTFLSDGIPGIPTKDLQLIEAGSEIIKSFILSPGTSDYVAYDYILIATTASCPPETFSSQQVYFRQQRENFATESAVPLVEAKFQQLVSIVFGELTGSVGTLDPDTGGLNGILFQDSVLILAPFASGTLSGSFNGRANPNPSSSLSSSGLLISRSTWLAGSGTTNPATFGSSIDGNLATRWTTGVNQSPGQEYVINFRETQSIGGFIMNVITAPSNVLGTFDVATSDDGTVYTSRSIAQSGSLVHLHVFTESINAVFLKVELKTTMPAAFWSIYEMDVINIAPIELAGFEFTGSVSGNIQGFISGTMTGIITHSEDLIGAVTASSTSQSLIDGDDFLYELFLEDAAKLSDGRVALYVSRRNIDSSSIDFGEYSTNKFETILFPQRVVEDEWSSSVDLISGTLTPAIDHSSFDIEFFQSFSVINFPSGSSSLREVLITHSVFDKDSFVSYSSNILQDTSSIDLVVITHSVFDKDSFVSYSANILQDTSSLVRLVITHSVFDKDSFVSYSADILSGSLE